MVHLNKNNIFIKKEHNHNLISSCFFLLSTLIFFILFLLSIMFQMYSTIAYFVIFLFFIVMKTSWQFKTTISFSNLVNKISNENIVFYISKSWRRKRESTIWIGLTAIFLTTVMLIINSILFEVPGSLNTKSLFVSIIICISILFIILLTMYFNIQILDENIKLASKKINFHSTEWEQIIKEIHDFYKSIFIKVIFLFFVIPFVLLIFKPYRNWIDHLIKN